MPRIIWRAVAGAAAAALAVTIGMAGPVAAAGTADPVPGPAGPPVPAAVAARIAYANCVPGGATASDGAIANQVRAQMNGRRLGRAVNAYNVSCARIITDTVRGRGLAQRAAVIAVTTAITESTLHNYTEAVDHDSLGLFQQRPSQGWGTPAQLVDPVYATNAFINAMLRKYPNNSWMSGDIGAICQRVQVSALPDAYGYEVHDAQLLVNALWNASVVGSLPGSRAFRYGDSQHVFARDAGGRLRHWYWAPGMVTAAQQDWGAVAGDPVGFVHGEGQHVFARGVSGSLRHWYWLPGMATAVEQDWGGTVTATPAAFTYGDSQHVFARDTAASMRHWYWSPGMTTPAQQDWGGTLN
jgi:hypothetical protein